MAKYIQVRISPNLLTLIRAIKLLSSNDRGYDICLGEASEILAQFTLNLAEWDVTKGNKLINEYLKIKKQGYK